MLCICVAGRGGWGAHSGPAVSLSGSSSGLLHPVGGGRLEVER